MTKKELEKKVAQLEDDVRREQQIKACLVQDMHKRGLEHDKKMKKSVASRRRQRHRLKNVFDLAVTLREEENEARGNRMLNVIIRLASGR